MNLAGSGKGQAEQYRIRGGVGQVYDRILAQLGPDAVHIGSPVRDISQDANGVTVRTENVTVKARRVIVATNTAMANFIRFDPILPPDRAQLHQRMPLGCVWKIWLCYDEAYWRAQGLCGESVSIFDGDVSPNARDAGMEAGKDKPGLMVFFVLGSKARKFNALTRLERKERILKEATTRFGAAAANLSTTIKFPAVLPQNPEADSYFEWNWSLDEFTRGDFSAVPGPGVWTGYGAALRKPVGRIHWAGVDTCTYPANSFSGAVQSGERAAKEVLSQN
jgi:monoamine oxidase